MLLTEEVKVRWHYSNKDHLISLGYKFTSYRDSVMVSVGDLLEESSSKVTVQCDYCGKKVTKSYRDYIKQNKKTIVQKDCCNDCKGFKQIEVCQVKYGVNGVSQVKEIRDKQKATTLLKYGVENISQVEEIKEKKKTTFIENYGVDNYLKTDEAKKRIKETSLNKYGVEHHLQVPEIYQKQINTNIEIYGVANVFQSEEIKEKSKQTLFTNYGVEHAMESEEIKYKARINANKALYKNGTAPCGKQQKYLNLLLGGELNYPVNTILLDIAFVAPMICVEFDGSGHRLSVIHGDVTEEEFNKKEARRNYALLNAGWKIIRIISVKDKLPSDDKLIEMYNYSIKHFKNDNSWIEFNIDEGIIRSSVFEKEYDFGLLRSIKEKDINKFNTKVVF